MRQLIYVGVTLIGMVIVLVAGLIMGDDNASKATPFPYALSTKFELEGTDGKPFEMLSFRDKWTVVYFGYTHCPDVCPTTGRIMAKFVDDNRSKTQAYPLQGYFVSVDPERDTLSHLKTYVSWFSPNLLGATGKKFDIDRLVKGFLTGYKLNNEGGKIKKDYLVFHPNSVYLVSPNQTILARVTEPKGVKDLDKIFLPLIHN